MQVTQRSGITDHCNPSVTVPNGHLWRKERGEETSAGERCKIRPRQEIEPKFELGTVTICHNRSRYRPRDAGHHWSWLVIFCRPAVTSRVTVHGLDFPRDALIALFHFALHIFFFNGGTMYGKEGASLQPEAKPGRFRTHTCVLMAYRSCEPGRHNFLFGESISQVSVSMMNRLLFFHGS